MNLVFIYGEIIEEIKFDFMINNKHVSIARFKMKLKNKSIIEVIGYDEIADLCYQKLKSQMKAYIQGKVTTKLAVEIENIHFNE